MRKMTWAIGGGGQEKGSTSSLWNLLPQDIVTSANSERVERVLDILADSKAFLACQPSLAPPLSPAHSLKNL